LKHIGTQISKKITVIFLLKMDTIKNKAEKWRIDETDKADGFVMAIMSIIIAAKHNDISQEDLVAGINAIISEAIRFGREFGEPIKDGTDELSNRDTVIILDHFNRWRRGADIEQLSPKLIGLAIDKAINVLKDK